MFEYGKEKYRQKQNTGSFLLGVISCGMIENFLYVRENKAEP